MYSLKPFDSQFKFWSGHYQTLIGHFLPSKPFDEKTKIYKVQLTHGKKDFCGIHVARPKIEKKKSQKVRQVIVVLFHGLGGSHKANYMQQISQIAFDRGWIVARVDHRGIESVDGQFTEPYHSGRGQDISDVLNFLEKKFPKSQKIAVGFSMSGAMLLNLVTGRFGSTKPDFAITVNAPLDLSDSAHRLAKGANRFYDLRFYFKLKKFILRHHPEVKLPLVGYTHTVDRIYTSVRSGFKDRDQFYSECSPLNHLYKIKTPTFVLTAQDDPIISYGKYKGAKWSNSCRVYASLYGGHVGYIADRKIASNPEKFGYRWMDYYFESVFATISKKFLK